MEELDLTLQQCRAAERSQLGVWCEPLVLGTLFGENAGRKSADTAAQ